MPHSQAVRKFGVLNHLASKQPCSDYINYENIMYTVPCLFIKAKFFAVEVIMNKMQRSNIYRIKER